MHDGARRRVLQVDLLVGVQTGLDGERGQRRFVEARQDEFLLARVVGDVANGVHAGDVGLEAFGVGIDLVLVEVEPPPGDRAELGRQPEEHQGVVDIDLGDGFVGVADVDALQRAVLGFEVDAIADHEPDLSGGFEISHLGHRGGGRTESVAAVDEGQRLGVRREFHGPVERRVAAAEHEQILAVVARRVADTVEHLAVDERLDTGDSERHRLERADPTGDHDGARLDFLALAGGDAEAIVVEHLDFGHLAIEVENRTEGLDLLHQLIDEFLGVAHRNGGDVVDRLIGVELGALAAGGRQGVDDMRLDAEQAEFEDLKDAAGARADDDDVCLQGQSALLVEDGLVPSRCPLPGSILAQGNSGDVPLAAQQRDDLVGARIHGQRVGRQHQVR